MSQVSTVKWFGVKSAQRLGMGAAPLPVCGDRGFNDPPWGPNSPRCLERSPVAVIMLTPVGNRPFACWAGLEPGCGNGSEGGVSRRGGTDGWKFSPRRAYTEQKAVGLVASHTLLCWALNTQPQAVPPSGPWELCVCAGPAATEEWADPCKCGHTSPRKISAFPTFGPWLTDCRPVPETREKNISFEKRQDPIPRVRWSGKPSGPGLWPRGQDAAALCATGMRLLSWPLRAGRGQQGSYSVP